MGRKNKNTDASPPDKARYDFSHGLRCPRCKTLDTLARSTQGNIQYRRCLRATCQSNNRGAYTVVGKPL